MLRCWVVPCNAAAALPLLHLLIISSFAAGAQHCPPEDVGGSARLIQTFMYLHGAPAEPPIIHNLHSEDCGSVSGPLRSRAFNFCSVLGGVCVNFMFPPGDAGS